jgi:hypothetical protein
MFNKLRNKIENFDDRPLEEITKHLDRLGITIAYIAGAFAVATYSDKILPTCPLVAQIFGLILASAGIYLIPWIGFGALSGLVKLDSGKLRSYIAGLLLFIISIVVGIGGIFAAAASLHH